MRVGIVVLLIFLVTGLGCAETTTQPVVPLSRPATELVVLVHDSGTTDADELSNALVRAGYKVTRDSRTRHDLSVRLQVTKENARYLGIFVTSDLQDCRATLEVWGPDSVQLDSLSREFTTKRITDVNLAPLVNALSRSRGLAIVLSAREQHRILAEQQELREQEEARLRREAEAAALRDELARRQQKREVAWADAHADECANPITSRSCDGVRGFLATYPAGSRVDDAQSILAAAEPKLSDLRDEEAWLRAHADDCKKPKNDEACEGIREYLAHFGRGKYAAQARDLLTRSEPAITRLRAKAAAETDASSGTDRTFTSSPAPTGGSNRTVHVRGYTRKDGTYVRPHRRSPRR